MKVGFRCLLVCFLFCLCSPIVLAAQQFSCQVQQAPTDAAAQAFANEDYAKASDLYAARAKSKPDDLDAVAGQIRSLIGSHQVDAAAALAKSSFAAHPKSAVLATALGEVRYRQGRLADAFDAYRTAIALDPCLPRTRYSLYRLMRTESMDASAYAQLQTAHMLEPSDPSIHMAWIYTLPLAERASQIGNYLATAKNQPADRVTSMKQDESRIRAILARKDRGCHLATSSPKETKLRFQFLGMDEGGNYHSIGFDVKLNRKAGARLELDTGSSGILIDRGTAKRAGLVPVANDTISGIGDQKDMKGYWAYADDLRIGNLEFTNCMVEVSDKRSILGIDGLIGADVFENYHVRLDFPLRQMLLSPLPTRPGESPHHGLDTSGEGSASAATASGKHSSATPVVQYRDRYIAPEMKSWSTFARAGDHILLQGELKDHKPRLFLMDSGSEMSELSIPAGKTIGKLHSNGNIRIWGISGEVKNVYSVDSGSLTFAGLRQPFRDMVVMNLDKLSNDEGMEVSGIIGLDTMIWLTLDIDYRDGLIHASYDPHRGLNSRGQFY